MIVYVQYCLSFTTLFIDYYLEWFRLRERRIAFDTQQSDNFNISGHNADQKIFLVAEVNTFFCLFVTEVSV